MFFDEHYSDEGQIDGNKENGSFWFFDGGRKCGLRCKK